MRTPEDSNEKAQRLAREEKFRVAIAEHIRTVGSRDWDSLREKPEWAPFYGKKAGVTADRQFWRLRAQVVRQNKADKTRPNGGREANEAQRAWADNIIEDRRASGQPLSPIQAFWMENGKNGQAKIDAALIVRQLLEDAQRLRNAAVDADGLVRDPDKLAQAIKLLKDVARFQLDIQPDLARLEQQKAFMNGLVAVLRQTLEDGPQDLAVVMTAISAFIGEWGLPSDEAA
jgi:hypothetical protein